jgi:hypothetical protein
LQDVCVGMMFRFMLRDEVLTYGVRDARCIIIIIIIIIIIMFTRKSCPVQNIKGNWEYAGTAPLSFTLRPL